MAETNRLEVCFDEAIPAGDLARVAGRLDDALRAVGCGRVIGSETFAEAQFSAIWSKVYVGASELEAAVRALRRELRALDVVPGTWVVQYEPEECWYEVWFSELRPPTWGW